MKKYSIVKFIIRLIISPLIFILCLIPHVIFILRRTKDFIKFGGEFIQYSTKEEVNTIGDIYKELKENIKCVKTEEK